MKFWSTSETTEDVGAQLSFLRRRIEEEVNKHLSDFQADYDGLPNWAVIFVCVSEEFLDFFSETFVMRKKSPTIEHRLQVDYNRFSRSNDDERLVLMVDVLRRSVHCMGDKKYNVDEERRLKLNQLIRDVENKIRLEISD